MTAYLAWWWRRWRAAHHQHQAYLRWYHIPTKTNADAWNRASEHHGYVIANPPQRTLL